ncbi:MAG: ferritin [bacterium]
MISDKMTKEINAQINRELYSAYLYLAMSADAANKGFKGAAAWFAVQFGEEQGHAMRFMKYLQDHNAKVELQAVDAPKKEWKDLLDMFQNTLAHEKGITASINKLMTLAVAEKDFATQGALQWFVNEQVEEEAADADVLWMLEMSAGSKGALFMADKKLGDRK